MDNQILFHYQGKRCRGFLRGNPDALMKIVAKLPPDHTWEILDASGQVTSSSDTMIPITGQTPEPETK